MKVWVLAGLFTAATIPFAAAAESTAECQLDESRRAAPVQRIDSTATNVGTGGGVPSTTTAQVTSIPRPASPVIREAAEEAAAAAPPPATTVSTQQQAQRTDQPARRRSGKRVPDAELIGPRGAL